VLFRSLELVGRFHLGLDFVTEGNLVMTAVNFAKYFPNRAFGKDPLSLVDMGVVNVEHGMEPATVQASLQRMLPDDVEVVTRDDLILREKRFWQEQAPVGYIFFVGVCVGFVVGVIICYQIIHADITDHMSEFATLKAMGYRDHYFFGLVICQSLYLSLFGFLPGLAASLIVYRQLVSITGLTMQMTPEVVLMVFMATVAMCIVSGLLALRQLLSADPASLF
jgi:putative ABC transport system permease protein